jgi:dienelactone hydrolase
MATQHHIETQEVRIDPPGLDAILAIPPEATGVVLFAHGSGSGRLSPRNNYVARALQRAGIATLLLDLLTPAEEQDRRNVFDINLLASRLIAATDWMQRTPALRHLPVGYFGASTGGGAALLAASERSDIAAVVSRGGRPDLAMAALPKVRAPTLLIVGGWDEPVIELNERALSQLRSDSELRIVPGATHLFEEPGTLDEVISQATGWFLDHFRMPIAGRTSDDRPDDRIRLDLR